MPMQLGPIDPHARRRGRSRRGRPVARRPLPDLGEPGRDHHESPDALRAALARDVRDVSGRHDHERDVDLARDRRHGRVGDDAVHHAGFGVHRVHGTVELGRQQVVEEPAADRLESRDAPITATDLGERNVRIAFTAASVSRCSNWSTASSVSRIGNSTSIDPGVARMDTVNPLARKTLTMPWFSGRTSATNVVMSCRGGLLRELAQQDRTDAPTLELVGHRQADLGSTALHADVLGAADHPPLVPALENQQREMVGIVDLDDLPGEPPTSIACDQKRRRRVSGERPIR